MAYTSVERQLKNHGIPFTRVDPSAGATAPPGLDYIQSSLMRAIPALCVQSSDILSGAPAAEAAMPNIRVIPLNWWSESKAQVSFMLFESSTADCSVYKGGDLCQAQVCTTTSWQARGY